MRSLFLLMPIVTLIITILVLGVFVYAMLSLAKSNRMQAESLKEIEKTLKRNTSKEESSRSE